MKDWMTESNLEARLSGRFLQYALTELDGPADRIDVSVNRDLRRNGLVIAFTATAGARLHTERAFVTREALSRDPSTLAHTSWRLVARLKTQLERAHHELPDAVGFACWYVGFDPADVESAVLRVDDDAPWRFYWLDVDLVDSSWEPTYSLRFSDLADYEDEAGLPGLASDMSDASSRIRPSFPAWHLSVPA